MGAKILRFIFFGNYFIGILAVALTIEAALQLAVPFNSFAYYALIFCAPIAYYTHAYMGNLKLTKSSNPRVAWYIKHGLFLKWSQRILLFSSVGLFLYLFVSNFYSIFHLPIWYWVLVFSILGVAILYYGLLPSYFFNLNLRNTGWLKPFIIGFMWACTANVLPLVVLKIQSDINFPPEGLWLWLFVKNWMFCTVNAIMFDIKDYAIDANQELKTFVVRVGIRKTIQMILIPLLLVGMLSLLIFTSYEHFPVLAILINLIPFLFTLLVAYSMQHRKQIMYYLIVIDGLILVKALCGILGVALAKQ
jgi:4-hydroxybenzoate polyprenyltransferase